MRRHRLIYERLTHSVIGAFYEVYNTLGFGFLEDVYMTALEHELRARGHKVEREVIVIIRYKGRPIKRQRLDMLVDDKLIVEGKSTYELKKDATRQLYNYLKASDFNVGLFLHFGPQPKFFRLIATDLDPIRSIRAVSVKSASHPSEPDLPN